MYSPRPRLIVPSSSRPSDVEPGSVGTSRGACCARARPDGTGGRPPLPPSGVRPPISGIGTWPASGSGRICDGVGLRPLGGVLDGGDTVLGGGFAVFGGGEAVLDGG